MGYFSNDTSQNQRTKHTTQGPPGVGFQLTQDGNYDIQDKRLTNVGSPQSDSDASTKLYVDQNNTKIRNDVTNINSQIPEFLKRDGSVRMTGNLDMGSWVITHHGIGSKPTDLVNRSYIDTELAAKANVGETMLCNAWQSVHARKYRYGTETCHICWYADRH